ncbi:MAG: hypothetical protein ABJH04_08845 [Cyclobacteriaceae bacterium]|jgi:hypothetical protein
MFESISWQEYLSTISLLIGGYYLVTTLLLFSSEITNIFKQKQFGTSVGETIQYQNESNGTDDLMGKVRYETLQQQNVPRQEKVEVEQLAFTANEVEEEPIEVFDELEDSRKKSIQNITEEVDALTQIISGNNKEEVVSLFQSLLSRYAHFIGTPYQKEINQSIYNSFKAQYEFQIEPGEINLWWPQIMDQSNQHQ